MGAQRTTFEKLQRDRAKKAKAAAKREKRLDKGPAEGEEVVEELAPLDDSEAPLSAGELLQRIEALHNRFEAKKISFEDFEEEKAELMRRLPID
jgi:hypothetical protein